MARLSARARAKLPASDFAGPGRTYPDENRKHAILAEQFAAHKGGSIEARVDAAVHKKYPDLGK